MDAAKSTLISVIGLVVLVLAVVLFRGFLIQQRDTCGKRLLLISEDLGKYAKEHDRKLPQSVSDLSEVLGMNANEYSGVVALHVDSTFNYGGDDPVPYLWDKNAHPFIGGVHVMYTDGSVHLSPTLPMVKGKN